MLPPTDPHEARAWPLQDSWSGSVANILVVERAAAEGVHVSFQDYFRVGLPVTIATLLLGTMWLWMNAG